MKRILSLVLTFILTVTLASCGQEEAITGMEYVEGQDQQYFYSDLGSNTLFTETEDGYYYFVGFYLCYTDKETMQSAVLCGRPDCLHQNETNPERTLDCNAYFSGAQFLQYYDGNLYVVSRQVTSLDLELTQLSLDGSKRKSIQTFPSSTLSFAIHRGMLYYTGSVPNEEGVSCSSLLAKPLLSDEEPEVLFTGTAQSDLQKIWCRGDLVYFRDMYSTEERFYSLDYQYNIQTGATTLLFDSDHLAQTNYSLGNQGLVTYRSEVDENDVWHTTERFRTDFNGQNPQEITLEEPRSGAHLYEDSQYLYQFEVYWHSAARPLEEQELSVISPDGKEVCSIPSGTMGVRDFLVGNDQYCFLYAEQKLENEDLLMQWYRCDKADFADGSCEPVLLMEMKDSQARKGYIYKSN